MTIPLEFQAVVLAAGEGSRMVEITAGKPKCLLPVGPKPLVWYTLHKLQTAGFTDVVMIVLDSQKAEIQNTLDKCDLDLKIDYVTVPEDKDDLGTADSLKLVQDKLKSDVLVVSCDFVSDIDLTDAINVFRKNDASITTLFLHPEKSETLVVPGPKSKHKPEKDLIGIDSHTSRLVFLASASDFETDVSLPAKLLRKHPNIKMYSNLIDSHVYLIKHWIISYLASNLDNVSSLKGELIPHIVRKQLSKIVTPDNVVNHSIVNAYSSGDIFDFSRENELDIAVREASSFNDHYGDMQPAFHGDVIRCYAYVAPIEHYGVRINTLAAYWSLNFKINSLWEKVVKDKELVRKHSKAQIKSTQIDDACIIWEDAKLNEKTSFKHAQIGANTEIHSFSRVFNSIVMNNVQIKEKVALENCIICNGATIESGCDLKNCIVGGGHVLQEQSKHMNEVLTEADRMMHF